MSEIDTRAEAVRRTLEWRHCKLARHRAALEAGAGGSGLRGRTDNCRGPYLGEDGRPSERYTATAPGPTTSLNSYTWCRRGLLRLSSARPACCLASVNLSSYRPALWTAIRIPMTANKRTKALRMTEENDNPMLVLRGHQADGAMRLPDWRLARTTRRVPGWRNRQASGGFDLCPAPGTPGPWPGAWGRRPGAGPLPGRREVNARSTRGPSQVTGRYMDLLADP